MTCMSPLTQVALHDLQFFYSVEMYGIPHFNKAKENPDSGLVKPVAAADLTLPEEDVTLSFID
jgi:hypothetical protein